MKTLLPFVILFIAWLTYEIKKSDRKTRKVKESFLEKEVNSNLTRKQSLDDLDYITIPLNKLPFYSNASEEILSCQQTIHNLSDKKIVNLTGISNTDLKLKYGAANLEELIDYDKNFTNLSRVLYSWGQELYNTDKKSDAKTVLEFAVSCKSDISKIYTLLATIYDEAGEKDNIHKLIASAEELNSLMKNPIIKSLSSFIC